MKPECEVKDLNFDEMDSSLSWEYVMLDTLVFAKSMLNILYNNQIIWKLIFYLIIFLLANVGEEEGNGEIEDAA